MPYEKKSNMSSAGKDFSLGMLTFTGDYFFGEGVDGDFDDGYSIFCGLVVVLDGKKLS